MISRGENRRLIWADTFRNKTTNKERDRMKITRLQKLLLSTCFFVVSCASTGLSAASTEYSSKLEGELIKPSGIADDPASFRRLVGPYYEQATGIFWGCLTVDGLGENPEVIPADSHRDCHPRIIGEAPEILWVYGEVAKHLAASYLWHLHPDPAEFNEVYKGMGVDEIVAARPVKGGVQTVDKAGGYWLIEEAKD